MKKLSFTTSAFEKGEVLTRSQLKKVLGGTGSGDGSGTGGGSGLCDNIQGAPVEVCYNCCIAVADPQTPAERESAAIQCDLLCY